jgi:hypothetical protein
MDAKATVPTSPETNRRRRERERAGPLLPGGLVPDRHPEGAETFAVDTAIGDGNGTRLVTILGMLGDRSWASRGAATGSGEGGTTMGGVGASLGRRCSGPGAPGGGETGEIGWERPGLTSP